MVAEATMAPGPMCFIVLEHILSDFMVTVGRR
jgi:hypothetical protein